MVNCEMAFGGNRRWLGGAGHAARREILIGTGRTCASTAICFDNREGCLIQLGMMRHSRKSPFCEENEGATRSCIRSLACSI
jgi:hypothetical protein